MIELKGVFENGRIEFEKPVKINKRIKVIVTFIDEDFESIDEQTKYNTFSGIRKLQREKYEDLPISWSFEKTSISDFVGVYTDDNITAEQIRSQAWKRSS